MRCSILFTTIAVLNGIVSALPTSNTDRKKRDEVRRSFYPKMLNENCVRAPDIERSNYVRVNGPRQDIAENQPGVPFTLDIGLVDSTTCEPLSGAMVEVWSANAVGQYGDTFLRGATASGENGIAEFQTIFPGFTSDGANHINVAVHSGDAMGSTVVHTGRLFFTDPWTDIISKADNYTENTHTRTLNDDDPHFATAKSNGYDPIVDITSIQDDWPEGIIGYITIAVDPST